jgi:hypothetical protein
MALCLAAAVVSAEAAAQGAAPGPAAAAPERRVESALPTLAAIPAKVPEPLRKHFAAVAVTYTDDADSVRLPGFASRTTPLPTRFFRVGVQWSF